MVSVVVPVYNVEKNLLRCIDSIIAQTYSDIEVILVDDGSPDSSGEICDAYAKKEARVRVIHKQNAGASAARNTGIEAANGDYIMFVDSDDYLDATMLEEMLAYSGSDIILSGIRYVKTDGTFIKEHFAKQLQYLPIKEYVQKEYATDANMSFVLGGPVNKLFSRTVLMQNNIRFNEALSICEDGLFVVQCLTKCSTVSSVAKAYYNYVQYGTDTLMCRYNANAIEACELYYKAICELMLYGENTAEAAWQKVREERFSHFMALFFQIYTRSGLSGKEKYRKAKEAFVNPIFKTLARQTKKKSFKALLIKTTAIIGWVWPLHVICSLVFRGK